jgi:hypothetical protein
MARFRHLAFAFTLAFVLAIGQYAGAVHALGHATEQMSHKPGSPAKIACDQCFACSQLSGGAPTVPVVHPAPAACAENPAAAFTPIALAATVVFLSRAPPVLA